jgi:hypothetical protein
MSVIALVTGFTAAIGGLVLLAIWLIEYDPEYQSAAATRLPIPIISAHVLLAVTALAFWVIYLATDSHRLAWATALIMTLVVFLGLTMAIRWLGVRKVPITVATTGQVASPREIAVPPERHFPLSVVIGHGIFALITFVLVVLSAIRG